MPADLSILHVDAQLIIVDKPAGMLAVPGRGPDKQDCVIARVQAVYPDALIVHRLDMATSGLLLLARGATMQRALSRAFAERRVHKRYQALVQGLVAQPVGAVFELDFPLMPDWPNRPRQKIDARHGKPSLTRAWVLEHHPDANLSRVALEPVTGRSHQLRVHLLAIGHPICGDALYAPERATPSTPRLMLHACELGLPALTTPEGPAGAARQFHSAVPF